jgi:hypothetical protein
MLRGTGSARPPGLRFPPVFMVIYPVVCRTVPAPRVPGRRSPLGVVRETPWVVGVGAVTPASDEALVAPTALSTGILSLPVSEVFHYLTGRTNPPDAPRLSKMSGVPFGRDGAGREGPRRAGVAHYVLRSTRCSLAEATWAKREALAVLLSEYGRVVNGFVDRWWGHGPPPLKMELRKEVIEVPGTWLTARLRKVAAREAIDMIRAARERDGNRATRPVHRVWVPETLRLVFLKLSVHRLSGGDGCGTTAP